MTLRETPSPVASRTLTARYIKNRGLEQKHGANTRMTLIKIINSMSDEDLEQADIIEITVEKRD